MAENVYQSIAPYKGATDWYSRDSHFYVAHRHRGSVTHMRCATDGCPVKWTLRGTTASPVTNQHNHPESAWIPNRNAMFQALKRRASEETTNLNRIYEEEAARYPDGASHLLWESVAPSMRKWRRAQQPAVPRNITDYAAALAEHPRHSEMLLSTVSAGGATAVILAFNGFAQCLRDSSNIVVDATFLTVPAGVTAAQILTIHSVIEGNNFHPVVALMENRRRALYEAVFRRVWQAAGNPVPQRIITDFESGLQTALEAVTGVQVQGCLFHFVQALLRHARSCGISVGRNSPGWQLVQLYAALALLPANQIRLGLAELPGIIEQRQLPVNQAFQDYFESQWMTRVGPERFSVHGNPHQTSNVAESFHASLRLALGPAPNIWRFTVFHHTPGNLVDMNKISRCYLAGIKMVDKFDVVSQKFAVCGSRLEAQRRGQLPRRNRERQYLRHNVHAANQRALDRGLITIKEFVDNTSRLLDVGSGIVAEDVPDFGVEIEVPMGPEVALPPRQNRDVADDEAVLEPEVVLDIQEPLQAPAPPRADAAPLLCAICLENTITLVLIPCGHPLCAHCHDQIIDCPFCRATIATTNPLYMV